VDATQLVVAEVERLEVGESVKHGGRHAVDLVACQRQRRQLRTTWKRVVVLDALQVIAVDQQAPQTRRK